MKGMYLFMCKTNNPAQIMKCKVKNEKKINPQGDSVTRIDIMDMNLNGTKGKGLFLTLIF